MRVSHSQDTFGRLKRLTEFSVSDDTIQDPRRKGRTHSSRSDDSHLGQRENTAYDRMPKLHGPSVSASKAKTKKGFELLTARMTEHGNVNRNWTGVSDMEGLRGVTRSKGQLTQISAIESLLKKETAFLFDKTDDFIAHRLRADPAIIGIGRSESFLSSVLEDSRALRLINQGFLSALHGTSNVTEVGFTGFALVCKEGQTPNLRLSVILMLFHSGNAIRPDISSIC